MKILSKYIIKTIFISIIAVALLWVIIFSLFDFLADSKNIGVEEYSLFDSLFVILLNSPLLIYKRLTVIMLIGVILALGHLASTSQLIVARSSGVSIFSLARLIVGSVLIFYLLVASFGELIAPKLVEYGINYKAQLTKSVEVGLDTQEFWLKDRDKIISVDKNYDGKNFLGVEIFEINDNKLTKVIKSKRMVISNENTILGDSNIYKIDFDKLDFEKVASQKINLLFDDSLVNTLQKDPLDLSIVDIYNQVKFLSDNNLNSGVFQIELSKRLIKPFVLIVTILFSMLFIFGSMRNSSMGKKLFLGIVISLVLELYLRIGGSLSLKFDYNYFVIVLLPLTIFFIVVIKLLLNKK